MATFGVAGLIERLKNLLTQLRCFPDHSAEDVRSRVGVPGEPSDLPNVQEVIEKEADLGERSFVCRHSGSMDRMPLTIIAGQDVPGMTSLGARPARQAGSRFEAELEDRIETPETPVSSLVLAFLVPVLGCEPNETSPLRHWSG